EPAPGPSLQNHPPCPAAHPSGRRWLLLMRFGLLNVTGFALAGAVWAEGWLDELVRTDTTRLSALIGLVFLFGLARCGQRVLAVSGELDQLQEERFGPASRAGAHLALARGQDATARASLAAGLKLELAARIAGVRHVADSLVMLGLIGTVIGFVIALGGVDPSTAGDASAIAPMVSGLVSGMSTALYTTLVGAVLNIWLMLGYRLLEGGTLRLFTGIVALGERHGQP
ncbi:MAG TPA: MotA/TolQ/ExbB proton channel family protein, partial [Geminicoccaceae bacterium]|nr:MotA/TolQ/ExbB proton channel family protein [Geminicoccaceae bacterium]